HPDNPVRPVRITPFSESGKILVVADGQEVLRLRTGETLTIHSAPFTTKIVLFSGYSFFSLLRNKLQWSSQAFSPTPELFNNSKHLDRDS
ncbi:MAG: hypothetical protein P9M15_04370, partial [Candidatus Electryoneaceae bacterium]|nr:hypothetical protein [Candidatus Electryoneaceae bacterium]